MIESHDPFNSPHLIDSGERGTYTRAKIRLDTLNAVTSFVEDVKRAKSLEGTEFFLEDFYGGLRVDASSVLGVIYASGEWAGEIYLVNAKRDGQFNSWVDKYRPC